MDHASTLLNLAKRVQALSENGQHYAHSDYDLDRYTELEHIAVEMISLLMDRDIRIIAPSLMEKNGYRTPKVDVRSVVFNDADEILMVREKIDGKWSLPGGWADVGYTPAEVAVKETIEEAGMTVRAKKLLGVMDKRCHDHPEDIYYAYKIFILCEQVDNRIHPGYETSEAGFFPREGLPELSTPRNTRKQLDLMFDIYSGKLKWPYIDLECGK